MSEPGEAGNRRGAGELASEVLGILQTAGEPLSPADVRERLGGELAYTTVVTILSRLHDKGVLNRQPMFGGTRMSALHEFCHRHHDSKQQAFYTATCNF